MDTLIKDSSPTSKILVNCADINSSKNIGEDSLRCPEDKENMSPSHAPVVPNGCGPNPCSENSQIVKSRTTQPAGKNLLNLFYFALIISPSYC